MQTDPEVASYCADQRRRPAAEVRQNVSVKVTEEDAKTACALYRKPDKALHRGSTEREVTEVVVRRKVRQGYCSPNLGVKHFMPWLETDYSAPLRTALTSCS